MKPAIYHRISRVVDRRFVFGDAEREQFRMSIRMQGIFSVCRVLSSCVMSNHFHVLLEVPPMSEAGNFWGAAVEAAWGIQTETFVVRVAKELDEASKAGREDVVAEIYGRFTCRIQSLSEFMKTLLQRFRRWFNRMHERSETLWEERYKSVIVAQTMEALVAKEKRDGVAGSWDGGDIALPGEIFHGWSGDWEQGFCERCVRVSAGRCEFGAMARQQRATLEHGDLRKKI